MRNRSLTRADIERHISELGTANGWQHHHARCPGVTAEGYVDGFPGEVLVRGETLLFVTIAGASGGITIPEQEWLDALASVVVVELVVLTRDGLKSLAKTLTGRTHSLPRSVRQTRSRSA